MKCPEHRQKQGNVFSLCNFQLSIPIFLFKNFHSKPAFFQFNYFGTWRSCKEKLISPSSPPHHPSPGSASLHPPQVPSLVFSSLPTFPPQRGYPTSTNGHTWAAPYHADGQQSWCLLTLQSWAMRGFSVIITPGGTASGRENAAGIQPAKVLSSEEAKLSGWAPKWIKSSSALLHLSLITSGQTSLFGGPLPFHSSSSYNSSCTLVCVTKPW